MNKRCCGAGAVFSLCSLDWPAQDYCKVRNYENGQRGTVCIKKNIQKSSNFLTQVKIKKYMCGPRGDQDGVPSHGFHHPSQGSPVQTLDYTKSRAE